MFAVLVRIHANLEGTNENVDESEDEIITKLRKVLENRSADEAIRLLDETKLGIIAAKKGHSIVIYIHCKTHDGLLQLIDLLKTNKLNEIVERIFIELLSIEYAMRVRLTWSSEEFKRVSTYFGLYERLMTKLGSKRMYVCKDGCMVVCMYVSVHLWIKIVIMALVR